MSEIVCRHCGVSLLRTRAVRATDQGIECWDSTVCVVRQAANREEQARNKLTLEQVRKHPEYLAMLANLTTTQARCTELLDQYRALKRETEGVQPIKACYPGCLHCQQQKSKTALVYPLTVDGPKEPTEAAKILDLAATLHKL